MNKLYLKYFKLLIIFTMIQILILNEVMFSAYINPFLYILLIIMLPLKTPKWFLLTYAFCCGLFIDLFSSSLGFHSSATVLIAFLKPSISKITIPHNILGENDEIITHKIGIKAYLTFAFILIFIHHLSLFFIEHLSFNFNILIKTILSSLISLIIILITQQFFYRNK